MKVIAITLLVFASAAAAACRRSSETPPGATEKRIAKTTLSGLCDAYTKAERQLPDPVEAYEEVRDHYTTLWPPLMKMRAGVEGIEAGARYPFWLRFARHDYGVEGWSCPALDRLLLRVVGRGSRPSRPPDAAPYPIVRVAASGDISIDGAAVTPAELPERLTRLKEQSHIVDLFREGWATKMPPAADTVLTVLVDERFIIGVCARPDCAP
jgi:hypothetical protein